MALKFPSGNKAPKANNASSAPVTSFIGKLFGSRKKGGLLDAGPASEIKATGPTTDSAFGKTGIQSRKQAVDAATSKIAKFKNSNVAFKIPLIGHLPVEKQLYALGLAVLACLLLAIAAVGWDRYLSSNNSAYTNISSQLQFHTQRLAKSALSAARGDAVSFPQLQDSRDQFQEALKVLNAGGQTTFGANVPSARSNPDLTKRLSTLTERFEAASLSATSILAAKKDLTELSKNVTQVRAGAEDLAAQAQEITAHLQQTGAPPAQTLKINRLIFFAERLGRNAAELLAADTIDPEVTFQMGKDTNDYKDLIKALESGSTALSITALTDSEGRGKVAKLKERFSAFETNITPILSNVEKLVAARLAGRTLARNSDELLEDVEQLQSSFAQARQTIPLILAFAFGVLTLSFLGLIALVFLADARNRAAESEQENKRNQEAILRLLNEMGDLADGDLTVRAKVTEDITGAIADSMNYTIDELRNLVTGVNNASTQVSAKSQQAQAVSVQLLDAAEKQSKEIQETTAQVLTVAETLAAVSASAEESSQVAIRSLTAADKGRLAVQNSIAGMNEIRDQIQETSKRIKRLGESSQEIGEIVELISDITEQTNVLALNAAIQAASAGEAGRGFSVVAEEVQRLAERSAEATKQIGAIVKTIQADTQDAVMAMEKSTSGVVEGAKLSDAAGQALSEIDAVTKNLATLIEKISTDTQLQAGSANAVAKNMQDILEINRQTTTGTQQTASSIKELADVASDLKSSVSGFKL